MFVISPPSEPMAPPMAWLRAEPDGGFQLIRITSSGTWDIACVPIRVRNAIERVYFMLQSLNNREMANGGRQTLSSVSQTDFTLTIENSDLNCSKAGLSYSFLQSIIF
jgi:hypothetical protein